jgi:ABC-type multidrug transport system permease subunit
LRPFLYSISFAYIQANVIFGARQKELCTIFFTGNAMMILMVLTFSLNFKLSFDLVSSRFIEYQVTILNPKLIFLQRLLFTTFFATLIFFPFFPISKLLLRHHLLTNNVSWLKVALVIFCATLCFSAYNILCACVMKNPRENVVSLWMRLNIPLQTLGGVWAPLYVVKSFVPWASYILYLNPIIYITEGLRRAILGSDKFLSVSTCCVALLALGAIFLFTSFYFFKKRVDHI